MSAPAVAPKKEASNGNESPATSDSESGWQEIPLKCYSHEDVKDKKFHIARFNSKTNVDVVRDFNKPVRLHRKDPRNIQFHLSRKEIDIKRREKEQRAAEREKRRQRKAAGLPVEGDTDESEDEPIVIDPESAEAKFDPENDMDLSQVAPEGGGRNYKKNMFKRKTKQINVMDDEKRKLRYEEYYPWVMEDYDGKNVFVGNYEAGASESTHVLFVIDKDGFKMMPAEKVYKFNPRNKYATLTLEEAEAKMEKKSAVPRWLMKHMTDGQGSNGNDKDYRFRNNTTGPRSLALPSANSRSRGLRTVMGGSTSHDRDSDHDNLDFDEEFADDEEAPIMDGDEEENKLSEEKIKKEMLRASHLEPQSDDDDLDDLFDTEKSRKIDKEGKKLRKVLNKTEGGVYDSDDDENLNPYLSKSDLESDDDSDNNVVIKTENDDKLDANGELKPQQPRAFFAHNVGDGFVVIKAPSAFLNNFQPGEWLVNGRKRPSPSAASPHKRQKSDEKAGREKSSSPTPTMSNVDLNNAGPDGALVTVREVLDILKDNPLTTKDLLVRLRNRVSAHKDNKQRIISIVKQNLKLANGKLVLKE